ncbi:MAG TPA: MBL fold metallo-hydrolase [Myxococcota bacterium]|nr:MBL fold metallo-hydrolase [Myxococcota bacterium]
MGRVVRWAIGLAVILGIGVAVAERVPAVQDAVMRAALARLVATGPSSLFGDDALRVLLCGTGSPLPHPTRAKACVAVFAAGKLWIVDTGPGSVNKLGLLRVDLAQIGGVLFTHYHSDHIGDLGELNLNSWVAGRPGPLAVYGPPGVERVVAGFQEAYALDTGYRVTHHGADFIPPERAVMEPHPVAPGVVLEENGLRITAFPVHHDPVKPAYGYRFDYKGRSVVVSGDTAKSESLVAAAQGADVLLHEAQANHLVAMIGEAGRDGGRPRVAKIMGDIPSYHTSPVDAAEEANTAGVKLLVFYHLTPSPRNGFMERVFTRGVSDVRKGDWILGDDGLLVELPADSKDVRTGQLD